MYRIYPGRAGAAIRTPVHIIAHAVSLSVFWSGRPRPCKAGQPVGRSGKVLSSLVVGGVFLFLAFRHVPLDQLGGAFRQLDVRWFVPAIALSLLLQVFRAWRWQLELRPLAHVRFGLLWVVTSVAYMAINLLPVRLGEVVRPWLL